MGEARAALHRTPTRDAFYSWLKRRIVMNHLLPGDPLTELGLARDAGCSQGTVREGLMRLQEDGLVTRAGRRGTTVTGLDPEEAEEILALRRRIELRGAERAARRASAENLAELAAMLEAMDRAAAADDEYTLIGLDMDFHLALFRIGGLHALDQILVRCTIHSHRSKLWAPGHRRPLAATAARHRPIFERLAAGDAAGLARALDHHLDTIVEVARAGAGA